jgi:hypothetical protein
LREGNDGHAADHEFLLISAWLCLDPFFGTEAAAAVPHGIVTDAGFGVPLSAPWSCLDMVVPQSWGDVVFAVAAGADAAAAGWALAGIASAIEVAKRAAERMRMVFMTTCSKRKMGV